MSRRKEEIDKMYGYLDKHEERYFDKISPHFSDNLDEEDYFKDKNYTLKNEIITKYIDRKYEIAKKIFILVMKINIKRI